MIARKAKTELEQFIIDNIRRFGWHSNSVGMEFDTAIFAYTVGLFHTYNHPELIVFGLTPRSSHCIFTAAAKIIAGGEPLDLDAPNDKLLADHSCLLAKVPKGHNAELMTSACWFYGGNRFPAYQVIWPSDEGYYPWHPDAADPFTQAQPILGQQNMSD